MPCTEAGRRRRVRVAAALACAAAAATLAACVGAPPPPPAAPAIPPDAPAATETAPTHEPGRAPDAATAAGVAGDPASVPATAGRTVRYVKLDPPVAPRSAAELSAQFAQRLVAAHPDTSFMGRAPRRLLAIPVIQVELNADGSVRRVEVLRKPSTGDGTTVLAIAAIHRAAPFGDVSALPRPWKVIETFLFDDDLRFKPRTLDDGK